MKRTPPQTGKAAAKLIDAKIKALDRPGEARRSAGSAR